MLADSSVNGIASDVRLLYYMFVEQRLAGERARGIEIFCRYSSVVFQMNAT